MMNLTKYKHIIWDWNGTLLDDAWLCVEVINKILHKRHLPPITHKQYQEEFDFPVIDFYRKIGFDFSIEPFEIVATEYIVEYDKRRFECKLQNDAISILKSCANGGLTQSILSAYQQTRLEEIVDYFQVRYFFTKLVGLNDYYAGGKIENGKRLIEELNFNTGEVLLVGDTIHDFEVAKTIGINCVLSHSGHNSRKRLELCGARIMNSIADVLTLHSGVRQSPLPECEKPSF